MIFYHTGETSGRGSWGFQVNPRETASSSFLPIHGKSNHHFFSKPIFTLGHKWQLLKGIQYFLGGFFDGNLLLLQSISKPPEKLAIRLSFPIVANRMFFYGTNFPIAYRPLLLWVSNPDFCNNRKEFLIKEIEQLRSFLLGKTPRFPPFLLNMKISSFSLHVHFMLTR